MQIVSDNHWTEGGDQYGRVRGRTEGAEGYCNPIRRTAVSTNPDPSEVPETKPKTMELTWAALCTAHVQQTSALYSLSGKGHVLNQVEL